jgi:hypothetical protein
VKREIQEPTWAQGDETLGDKTTHPAFGQIVAHRVQGHRALYGSEFRHNAYMSITIRTSMLRRSLSNDWHFADKEIISVDLSEAQWATFVSAPNVGSGVPCTIDHIKGEMMPLLPDPKSSSDQFAKEVKAKLDDSIAQLKSALAAIDEMGLPKGKAQALKAKIERSIQQLSQNLPFVAEQFGEHVENTVEKAKAEIHGYMTQVIQRAGIESLTGGKLPLEIEAGRSSLSSGDEK